MGLFETGRRDDAIYLRGTGRAHHVLAFYPSRGPAKVWRVVFEAADRQMVDRLHDKVAATGAPSEVTPKQLKELHIRLNLPEK